MIHELFDKQNIVLVLQLGYMLEKINAKVLDILDHIIYRQLDTYARYVLGQTSVPLPCIYTGFRK